MSSKIHKVIIKTHPFRAGSFNTTTRDLCPSGTAFRGDISSDIKKALNAYVYRQPNSTHIVFLVYSASYRELQSFSSPFRGGVGMYVILKIQVHFLDMPKIPMYCVMFLSELRSSPDALNTSAPQLLPAAFASLALNESSHFRESVQNSCSESKFLVKLEYHFQICFYKCICPIIVLGKLL